MLALVAHARQLHAGTQGLQQRRQAAQYFGAFRWRDLGADRPDQIGSGSLQLQRHGRVVAHSGCCQHFGPDPEQEVAHAPRYRHLIEHPAQHDHRLNRQRLALLDLLQQRHAAARSMIVELEIAAEKCLELIQHHLEDAPTGFGIGLNHLDHALDFASHGITDEVRSQMKTHHASAHAVDQAARRMVNRSKEIRLAQRHPQGRHLQAGKPQTQRCRDALFGEDALKHHCDNLDCRPLCRGVSSAFEQLPGGLTARLQFQQLLRHRHVLQPCLDDRLAPCHILLMLNRRGQPR